MVATRQEFKVSDESGYEFTIIAEQDCGGGWRATVALTARGGGGGFVAAEDAVASLAHPLEHLLRMLKE
jgi:hypothetical protein